MALPAVSLIALGLAVAGWERSLELSVEASGLTVRRAFGRDRFFRWRGLGGVQAGRRGEGPAVEVVDDKGRSVLSLRLADAGGNGGVLEFLCALAGSPVGDDLDPLARQLARIYEQGVCGDSSWPSDVAGLLDGAFTDARNNLHDARVRGGRSTSLERELEEVLKGLSRPLRNRARLSAADGAFILAVVAGLSLILVVGAQAVRFLL